MASRVMGPGATCMDILVEEPASPYDNLIHAIGMVETRLDTTAVNLTEEAFGFFQVRPIRLEDYQARTGIRYQVEDMLDFEKAREVFIYYAELVGPRDMETIARRWNGSGPKTTEYWQKVKANL